MEATGSLESRYASRRGPVTIAESAASDAIRVLLVEDDAEFAEMYRMRLEADGYSVNWASNGCEGLRLAHTWEPDLIFLDVRMPEMDGLDVLRALHGDPDTADVPVVMFTNYDDEILSHEGQRLGILDWRSKIETTPAGVSSWIQRWSIAQTQERRTP